VPLSQPDHSSFLTSCAAFGSALFECLDDVAAFLEFCFILSLWVHVIVGVLLCLFVVGLSLLVGVIAILARRQKGMRHESGSNTLSTKSSPLLDFYNYLFRPFFFIFNALFGGGCTLFLLFGISMSSVMLAVIMLFSFIFSLVGTWLSWAEEEDRKTSQKDVVRRLYYGLKFIEGAGEILGIAALLFIFSPPNVVIHTPLAIIIFGMSLVLGVFSTREVLRKNRIKKAKRDIYGRKQLLLPPILQRAKNTHGKLEKFSLLETYKHMREKRKESIAKSPQLTHFIIKLKNAIDFFGSYICASCLKPFFISSSMVFAVIWNILFFTGVSMSFPILLSILIVSFCFGFMGAVTHLYHHDKAHFVQNQLIIMMLDNPTLSNSMMKDNMSDNDNEGIQITQTPGLNCGVSNLGEEEGNLGCGSN